MKFPLSLPVIFIVLALAGCSRYGYVRLNYPLAPVAYLPDNIHSIAVVNRSLTGEKESNDRLLESIATGEVAGSDRLASDECVRGVYDAIRDLEQTELVIPEHYRMDGTGTRQMPELLDWEVVRKICTEEGSDALLVLETFDSNSDILLSAATQQVAAILSTGAPKPVGPGQVKVNVVCNWRLYDPSQERIIDQYQHNNYMTFDLRASLPPPHALPQAAYAAGVAYIQRFLPGSYMVRRTLYKRTSGNGRRPFKAGYRMSEVANWTGAMEIWGDLTEHPKRKTAGRACLNMAVSNEVLGNTDTALNWAQRSYEFHRDKLGRTYSKVLLNRKSLEGLAP